MKSSRRFSAGRFGFLLVILLLLIVQSEAGWAQKSQRPQFRVSSELVLVDLIATDAEGRLVPDLTREQLSIFEDGKPRRLQFFQRVLAPGESREAASPLDAGTALRGRSRAGVEATGAARPSPIIVLIDLNSMDHLSLVHARESTAALLGRLQDASSRVMVAAVNDGLSIVQPFTASPEEVRSALSRLKTSRASLSYSTLIQEVSRIYHVYSCQDCDPLQKSLTASKIFLSDLNARVASTLKAFKGLAEFLQSVPGRKNVVFFSDGYPLQAPSTVLDILDRISSLHPASVTRMLHGKNDSLRSILSARLGGALGGFSSAQIRRVLRQLNSAQVSLYSVDARGLTAETVADQRQTTPNQLVTRYNSEDISANQEYLKMTAEMTGGLTLLNSNQLETGVQQAVSDAHSYYVIGYEPLEKARGGHFSKITIKSSRPGVKLRYRSGYFRRPGSQAGNDNLSNAFRFPGLYQDFPMQVGVETSGKGFRVSANIPTGALHFGAEGEKKICTLELYGALKDQNGKWVGGAFIFARKFPISVSRDQLAQLRRRANVTAVAEGRAGPGRYQLIVVARQSPGGILSAFRTDLRIASGDGTAEPQ